MIQGGGALILLVDTDVFSFFEKRDSRRALYAPLLDGYRLALSFMTIAEIYQWAAMRHWSAKRIATVERSFQTYLTVMADVDMCQIWARIRAERKLGGHPLEAQDAWVAATALRHNIPLVTHNAKDYQGISGLDVRTANP